MVEFEWVCARLGPRTEMAEGGRWHALARDTGHAMAQENVEVVRQANEAFESGNLPGAMRVVHPELVTYRADPDAATFYGREGFLDAFADWLEGFAEYGFAAEEYIDAGDRVLVRFRQWGRGETSAAAVEGPVWLLYTVSEGKITRLDIYNSEQEALEAAGRPE